MPPIKAAVLTVLLLCTGLLACTLEETIVVTDPETGKVHTIGAQGREVATAEVCAAGDYVPTPLRATVRAAGCYNRGQQDAFDLRFQYSARDGVHGLLHGGRQGRGHAPEPEALQFPRRLHRGRRSPPSFPTVKTSTSPGP